MLAELEKNIGYTFKNKELLICAVTHNSYANEHHCANNERLEFLGDSLLGMLCALRLYEAFPEEPEGKLTKARASLVCENACFEYARTVELGKFMNLGRGEEKTGRYNCAILADAFEALIAAMYLDGGMESAAPFVLGFIEKHMNDAILGRMNRDYKTRLQEIVQRSRGDVLEYVPTGESGPEHDKVFTVLLKINSNVFATGTGHSKKQAEQDAAGKALELMGVK